MKTLRAGVLLLVLACFGRLALAQPATDEIRLDEHRYFNVWALDFSPDDKLLAASSPSSDEVHVWDWRNRRIVRVFKKSSGVSAILASDPLRFSPNGQLLAACDGGRAEHDTVVRIWSVATGGLIHGIDDPVRGGNCDAIEFTPDGKYLVRVLHRFSKFPADNIIFYSTVTWQPTWGLRTTPFYTRSLSISPDGKLIAVGGTTILPALKVGNVYVPKTEPDNSQIVLVDIAQRTIVRTIEAFPGRKENALDGHLQRLAWSPDGKYVAAGAQHTKLYTEAPFPESIRIFDAVTGKQVAGEPSQYANISTLRYTADGKYLIEGAFHSDSCASRKPKYELLRRGGRSYISQCIRIWDGLHTQLLQEIPGNPGSAAVTHDGHHVAFGGDGAIYVFELK